MNNYIQEFEKYKDIKDIKDIINEASKLDEFYNTNLTLEDFSVNTWRVFFQIAHDIVLVEKKTGNGCRVCCHSVVL